MIKYLFDRLPHDTRRSLYATCRSRSDRALQEKRTAVSAGGTSYRPFDENRCLFVNIPGTGGEAVSRALFGNLAGGHDSIYDYQLAFSKAEFDAYFKFCFVRNPWGRVLWAYNYLRSSEAAEQDRKWAEHHLSMYRDFADFVERGLTLATVMDGEYFIPQYKFITTPVSDEPVADFIGRYENLEKDFDFVRKKLGKPESVSLGRRERTPEDVPGSHRSAYTPLAREIVARAYAGDIEMFGYKFG